MNDFGSVSVRVGILQRVPHLMDLIVRNRPGTAAYRLWGARNLMDAYGAPDSSGINGTGGTLLLETRAGGIARSTSVIRRGILVEESRKGQTSFQLDIEDFIAPANPPPIGSDSEYLFARVQEKRVTSGWVAVPGNAQVNANMPIRGPILIVPPPLYYGMSAGVFSLYGQAPIGTTCTAGSPPVMDPTGQVPPPLYVAFPRGSSNVKVKNNGQSKILLSFGLGMPMVELPAGDEWFPVGGGYSQSNAIEVVVAAAPAVQAAVPFVLDVLANLSEG